MNDAGRVGFVLKGEYSPAASYENLDVVHYNGSSYAAKKNTRGNAPADNSEYWQIVAKSNDFVKSASFGGGMINETIAGTVSGELLLTDWGRNFFSLDAHYPQAANGIIFEADERDGIIYYIDVTGTANADAILELSPIALDEGTYALSGSDDDGVIFKLANSTTTIENRGYDSITFTIEQPTVFDTVQIVVKRNTDGGFSLYPMLEKGTENHDYYIPYRYKVCSSNSSGSEVIVTANSKPPVTGLKAYNVRTDISTRWVDTDLEVLYPTNKAGAGLLKAIAQAKASCEEQAEALHKEIEQQSPIRDVVYEYGIFRIAGAPKLFKVFKNGTLGTLKVNASNFVIDDSVNVACSAAVFPIKIDFSKYRYLYIETGGNRNPSIESTSRYGDLDYPVAGGLSPYVTNSLTTTPENFETTSRGLLRRYTCNEGTGYLAISCSRGYTANETSVIYRIWLEK